MVLPIQGPITDNVYNTGTFPGEGFIDRSRYRQAKPYDIDLPYQMYTIYNITRTSSGPAGTTLNSTSRSDHISDAATTVYLPQRTGPFGTLPAETLAIGRARERLFNLVNQRAEFAVNALQLGRTVDLIQSTAMWSYRVTRAILRGDFARVARMLRTSAKPKNAAQAWLAYQYGVRPFMMDIDAGMRTLSRDLGSFGVQATGSGHVNMIWRRGTLPSQRYYHRAIGRIRARAKVQIQIKNPNLYLYQNLGLTNPAALIWELVPFSFVFDWWVDVGSFLSALDETLGLKLTDQMFSVGYVGESIHQFEQGSGASYSRYEGRFRAAQLVRVRQLPPLKLRTTVNPFAGRGVRAGNAVALLLQFLPSDDVTRNVRHGRYS